MRIQRLLRYWRHCLADGELSAPQGWQKSGVRSVTFDELIAGRIDSNLATRLVDKVEDALNQNRSKSRKWKGAGERLRIESADVAMAPFQLRRSVEHGQSQHQDRHSHAPFWIAARLWRDGLLTPPDERAAWFVRAHLDPSGRNDTVVGSLDAMDAHLGISPAPQPGEGETSIQWPELVAWTKNFFKAVTGSSLKDFRLEDHERLSKVCILPHSSRNGSSRHLLELYDALLPESDETEKAATSSRLLAALSRETVTEPIEPEPPLNDSVRLDHLGHMTELFGLGPSQRESLHALFRLPEGEMMALNGPPGTGKTAWIQSAVASLWVDRALTASDPPIVVATSANNRAVTNILETFQKASPSAASGLAERWLPEIATYGLFLPSEGQIKKTGHRWASRGKPRWLGLPEEIETPEYLEEGCKQYLKRASSYYEMDFAEIDSVVEHLHARLRATRDQMVAIHAAGQRLRSLRDSIPDPSPEEARGRLAEGRRSAQSAVDDIELLAQEVDDAAAAVPLFEELLSFLPPIRDRRNHRFVRLFKRHDLSAPSLPGWRYRPGLEAAIDEHRRAAASRLLEIEASWQAIDDWEAEEQAWLAHLEALVGHLPTANQASAGTVVAAATDDPLAVESLVDQTLRRELFLLAGRYWEGRWLCELRSLIEDSDPKKLHRQSRLDCVRRFQRFAMVTPLFVSTVYMLPKFFDYFDRGRRHLIEGIDLLIVEEAGQVAPELGGALFALAKRAVVLGDVFQIEPVWNIGRAIDDANRQRHSAEGFHQQVFHSSRGSLMGVAQARTRYATPRRSDGLWLREHRRCVPGVIAYCQQLVPAYRDVLEPHRPEISSRELPALGWAHVRSASRQAGGSWRNPGQAEAIARWVRDRKAALESFYDKKIEEIIGIVTPYRAQVSSLREGLYSVGIDSKLEIGTVHTFQGGELPVMLFSPVVTRDQRGTPFFDRNINMLNVAVSRAQDSFLVFGDMRGFDPASSKPSGILARFLFAEESNQLPDVDSEPELLSLPEVSRISSLQEHRRVLREAFEHAKQELLIVSPYLTGRAVEADRLLDRIGSARARVSIAYSIDMAKNEARGVAKQLESAGAEVIRLRGFHTKTLAVDDSWFTHGSFNWLSAVRQEGERFQYQEASIRCGQPLAATAISEIWQEIDEGRVP